MSWETLAVIAGQVVTAVAIVAALRADVSWLKRWTRDHSKANQHDFDRHDQRISALEGRRS